MPPAFAITECRLFHPTLIETVIYYLANYTPLAQIYKNMPLFHIVK
jgi:hypothetical protein